MSPCVAFWFHNNIGQAVLQINFEKISLKFSKVCYTVSYDFLMKDLRFSLIEFDLGVRNMKSLVIAEKPSVARDIARVLGANQKNGGVLEGKKYVVTWALGHLITLADPEEYDKKYEKWEMSTLPMMPKDMKLVVIRQTGKQFSVVKTQLFRKDIEEIIIATDAGREGELVARWILEKAGCHKPIKRLWISSVTDKAIKEGFANLKDGHAYDNLYRAAVARAEADWLVGMNGTRALTCKYNAQLSCGRVQTPTLAMIARREEEIRQFTPKEYYGVSVETQDVKWTWRDEKTKSFRTFSREKAEEIRRKTETASLEVTRIEEKTKKSMAPGLYDLTTLQREANQKYGFSAKETLNIMFLLFNVYPAKVFMGDTGSLALGGFVAGAAYMMQMPLFILLIGLIYLVEVLSVMIQVTYFKATHGKRIFKMAPIHHHFELCGWSETRVVAVFSVITAVMCLIALLAL